MERGTRWRYFYWFLLHVWSCQICFVNILSMTFCPVFPGMFSTIWHWSGSKADRHMASFQRSSTESVIFFVSFSLLSVVAYEFGCQFILHCLLSDILYLNKQRIRALEELDRANREKQLLLDQIEQLEVKKQAGGGRGTTFVGFLPFYRWSHDLFLFILC